MTTGQLMREGTCAYVSQQAWIVNASFKENILFGEEYDAKRYYKTLTVCCLKEDLYAFPNGDETEIGERGINLSGGQKQRLSLARAFYANRYNKQFCIINYAWNQKFNILIFFLVTFIFLMIL